MKQLIALLFLVSLFSCGPGANEIAAVQKQREDSIRNATRLHIEKQQALKKSLESKRVEKSAMENNSMVVVANLEAAKDKLNSIKQYQFLRTADERQAQIASQVLLIQEMEKEWADAKASVVLLQHEMEELTVDINRLENINN